MAFAAFASASVLMFVPAGAAFGLFLFLGERLMEGAIEFIGEVLGKSRFVLSS